MIDVTNSNHCLFLTVLYSYRHSCRLLNIHQPGAFAAGSSNYFIVVQSQLHTYVSHRFSVLF